MKKIKEYLINELLEYCDEKTAEAIIHRYEEVIETLHDRHDTFKIQAERYWFAHQKNIEPDDWLEHIMKVRNKYKI